MDHIFIIVTILRNRIFLNKSTFVSYIDFSRGFDSINRNLLLYRLSNIGITGKMYSALSSLYRHPQTRIVLNNIPTDYFSVPLGVKQGSPESPTIFAIFIDTLAQELNNSGKGITLEHVLGQNDDENRSQTMVTCLFYCDDIALLAENEEDLEFLLNILHSWCLKYRMSDNMLKTNIQHVRPKRVKESTYTFYLGGKLVEYCSSYKYLGVTIDEHMSFQTIANRKAEPAGRALGSVIAKHIKSGGLPLDVFQLLWESCVLSVALYGSEIWGF